MAWQQFRQCTNNAETCVALVVDHDDIVKIFMHQIFNSLNKVFVKYHKLNANTL